MHNQKNDLDATGPSIESPVNQLQDILEKIVESQPDTEFLDLNS